MTKLGTSVRSLFGVRQRPAALVQRTLLRPDKASCKPGRPPKSGVLSKKLLSVVPLLFAVSLAPSSETGLNEAVRLYQRGEYQQAADLLASLSRSSPGDPAVRLWLGKAYLKIHKWDEAVRELERAVQLVPSRSEYHLWLGRAYGEKASRAFFLKAPGWAAKARNEFETAVRISPDNMDARFDLLEFYIDAPGIIGGGREQAEAQIREIARLNPRLGHTARARFYEDKKRWDLARQELEKSTRESPDRPESFLDLADFCLKQGDAAGAESHALKALELDNKSPRGKFILSAAQIQMRKSLPDAEKRLRDIASGPLRDDDPSFAEVYYWLGQALLAQGKRPEARHAFEAALGYDPEHAKAKAALSQLG